MEKLLYGWFIILILFIHWIADFIFQSDWMATNKSKNSLEGLTALFAHIGTYTLLLSVAFGWKYGLINGALHLAIDAITSRLSSLFYEKEQRHIFFAVIGFDQFLHAACLILTAKYIIL